MISQSVTRVRHPLALRLQCRKEWTEGQGTLTEIAAKHNVPPQTLIAWYRRDHWSQARRRWREKQMSDSAAPEQPIQCAPIPTDSASDPRARKIQRLELQLEALDNLLDAATTADEWHKLSMARQRLFEQWRILSGIPLPGSRRPAREKAERAQRSTGPLDA